MNLKIQVFLFFLGCLFYVSQPQVFYSCGFIMAENCSTYFVAEVCGTDGTTYQNKCFFGQKHCSHSELHIKYEKACDPTDFMTTPHPTAQPNGTHGDHIVHDIFCAFLPYSPDTVCPGPGIVVDPVCGNDGITYENFCEYEKAKCMHASLHVAGWGNCTSY